MFSSSLLTAFLALPAIALAQLNATASGASGSSVAGNSSGGTTHTVMVGKDGLTFTPNSIQAAVGDSVTFTFYAKNHTLTQSSFAEPCTGLGTAGAANGTVAAGTNAAGAGTAVASAGAPAATGGLGNMGSGSTTKTVSGSQCTCTCTDGGDQWSYSPKDSQPKPENPAKASGNMGSGKSSNSDSGSDSMGSGSSGSYGSYDKMVKRQAAAEAPAASGMLGLDSGYVPVSPNVTSGFPTFTMTVSDTKPLWFSCMQLKHCGSGMVFAINAPATGNTFDKYLTTAKSFANVTTGYAASARLTGQGCSATAQVDNTKMILSSNSTSSNSAGGSAAGSAGSSPVGSAADTTTSSTSDAGHSFGGAVSTALAAVGGIMVMLF